MQARSQMAIARRMYGKSGVLTSAKIKDMRNKALGGGKVIPPKFPHENPHNLTFM